MFQLSGDLPPSDPAKPEPILQEIKVRTLSTWSMFFFGLVTGFAGALGTMLLQKASGGANLKGRR